MDRCKPSPLSISNDDSIFCWLQQELSTLWCATREDTAGKFVKFLNQRMTPDRTLKSTIENMSERTYVRRPLDLLNTMFYLFPTATNVAPCHFSRGFPRTRGQRTLTTSLTRLLDNSFAKPKCGFKSPWVFHQAPSSTRHLHQCFRKCLTRQSNVWSGSAVLWKYNVDTKVC